MEPNYNDVRGVVKGFLVHLDDGSHSSYDPEQVGMSAEFERLDRGGRVPGPVGEPLEGPRTENVCSGPRVFSGSRRSAVQ